MPITIRLPLDLPDVRVLASRELPDATLLINVESTLRTAQCHHCGRELDRVHGIDRPIRLRHLPVFGRAVLIEIRPKRYRCPYCEGGPTSTQRCAWYEPNRPHTRAFEQDVLKRLVHSTVADVSWQCPLGVKAVEGIVDHHVTPAVDLEPLHRSGHAGDRRGGPAQGSWCLRGGGLDPRSDRAKSRPGGVARHPDRG